MGFRGEALPSIASVSRMTLITRRAGDDAATRIAIDAGRLVSVSDAGAPVGTTVEVADLLYNVPARLKFLKGEATEASHITELVSKVAMAYPRLHLRLRHNGRTALDVPPDRDGFARAQALLGPRVAARMVPVSGEESGVRVTAYLGAPELAQATARGVQLFVGRRPVRDRGLLHALAMGYGELVPRGRYPFAVVQLDVPAGTVDVNVHPQKLEVRFSDPAVVCAAVRHVVQAGVAAARWRDDAAGGSPVQLVGMIGTLPGIAPPLAPHGGAATPLAERHAAQMRSRQVSLGFDPAPEVSASRRPGAEWAPRTGSPRDWARSLREQTQASRVAEEPAVYRPGGGEDVPRLPSLAEHVRQAMGREEARGAPVGGEAAAPEDGGDRGSCSHVGAVQGGEARAHVGGAMSDDATAPEASGGRVSHPHVGAVQGGEARGGSAHVGVAVSGDAIAPEASGSRVSHPHVGAVQGGDARGGSAHVGAAMSGEAAVPGETGERVSRLHARGVQGGDPRAHVGGAMSGNAGAHEVSGERVSRLHAGDVQGGDPRAHMSGAMPDEAVALEDGGIRVSPPHVGAVQGGDARAGSAHVGAAMSGEAAVPGEAGGRVSHPHVGAVQGGDARAHVGAAMSGDAAWGNRVSRPHVGAVHGGDASAHVGAVVSGDATAPDASGDRVSRPHARAVHGGDASAHVGAVVSCDATAPDASGDRVSRPHARAVHGGDASAHVGAAMSGEAAVPGETGDRVSRPHARAVQGPDVLGAPGFDAAGSGEPFADLPSLPRRLAVGTAPIHSYTGGFFSQLRYLGQLDLTYLACEGDGELVLVDQHAAHERVELARLRERHAGGDARVAVQNMLFPVTLDATPAQLALVARVGELLAQVGFEVEPFGKATLALKAVPAGIRHGDPAQLLRRLLHEWAEAGAPSEAERLDALLGTIACHSVVRAGDRLAPGEVETLLRSLDGVDLSLPAPHGRAVLLRLPLSEIGRRFGRS